MNSINSIGPIGESGGIHKSGKTHPAGKQYPSFQKTLEGFMKEVNEMQNKADESIEKMVAGEITDMHQVMNTVNEAGLAFNTMMEIRNKVMDAYQEIMRLRL